MPREALLTAAFIQEIWLWYVIMSSRRRCHALWNTESEKQSYGEGASDNGTQGIENDDINDGDLVLDGTDHRQVAFSLPTTAKRILHLESVIKLVKEMKFTEAKYVSLLYPKKLNNNCWCYYVAFENL